MINIDRDFSQKAKIRVIGVGGCGNNSVDRMIEAGIEGIDFIAVNTDSQALQRSKAETRIQLGDKLTNGLGAGGKPEIGMQSAEESIDAVTEAIEGADMIFVAAGMGGGTGTGAAPVIAGIAKGLGILTVGVVTKPFDFEGPVRKRYALSGIAELQKNVDALIIIPNQKLYGALSKNATQKDALKKADEVLIQGVSGISDLITKPGDINLDFADVRTVMKDKGMAHMGIGTAAGEDRGEKAMSAAINSPLLETSVKGAQALLVCFSGGDDITLADTSDAMDIIYKELGDDVAIYYGSTTNDNANGELTITVIATGFDGQGNSGYSTYGSQSRESSAAQRLFGRTESSNIFNTKDPKRDVTVVKPIIDGTIYTPDDNPIDLPDFLTRKKKDPYK